MKFHESLNEFHNSFERERERERKKNPHKRRFAPPKFRCAFKRKITTLGSLEFETPSLSLSLSTMGQIREKFSIPPPPPPRFELNRADSLIRARTLLLVLNSNEIVQLLNPPCYFARDNETPTSESDKKRDEKW